MLFQLGSEDGIPIYLRVANAIIGAIRDGRLAPGQPLPGTRAIASSLGVSRSTVLAAVHELQSQGWLHTNERFGTFVAPQLPPDQPDSTDPPPPAPGEWEFPQSLGPLTERSLPGYFDLREGVPDVRLFKVDLLARAYRRALTRKASELLGEADPCGHPRLRNQLVRFLGERCGLALSPANLVLTRGHHSALALATKLFLNPNEQVAVEDPGNPKLWAALRHEGLQLVPVPVDADGMRVDVLASLAKQLPIRMVCISPFAQFPTGAVLSMERRGALLELAKRHQLVIAEEDQNLGLGYSKPPPESLMAQDRAGRTFLYGGFSRALAPGLRMGFLAAAAPVAEQIGRLQARREAGGDSVLECALAEMMEDGEIDRHMLRARLAYTERRDVWLALLRESLGDRLELDESAGGLGLWARAKGPGIDLDRWAHRARENGILFHPDRRWSFSKSTIGATRLGFAALAPEELAEAAQRLRRAYL